MIPAPLVEPMKIAADLRLMPLVPAHAEDVFRLVDEDRIRLGARLPWVRHTLAVTDTEDFIRDSVARRDVHGGGDGSGDWTIQVGTGNQSLIVGMVGIHAPHWQDRRVTIGYWIAGAHEGRGWITRSVGAVVERLQSLGMHRIEIRARVDNPRSRAVPERLGFTLEGELRSIEWFEGRAIDHAVYSRLATD